MTYSQLWRPNLASLHYTLALGMAYRRHQWIWDPDYASVQDHEAWIKVRRDANTAHAISKRRGSVAALGWTVQPASDSPEDELCARLQEGMLSHVRQAWMARYLQTESIFRGSAYQFIEGEWRWVHLAGDDRPRRWWVPCRLRHVDRWRLRVEPDPDREPGSTATVWQLYHVGRQEWMPLRRPEWFVSSVYEDSEDTLGYGRGLLQAIFFYWRAKEVVLTQGLAGVERWAQGIIHVALDDKRPGSVGKDNATMRDEAIAELKKHRSEHVLVHSKDDAVEVLTGGMEGHQLCMGFLEYLDKGIDRLCLTSTLPTGGGDSSGSKYGSSVQAGQMEGTFQHDRLMLAEDYDHSLLDLCWRLNLSEILGACKAKGLPLGRRGKLVLRDQTVEDPDKILAQVRDLTQVRGLKLVKREVYERLGWTMPRGDEETIGGEGPPQQPGGGGMPPGMAGFATGNGAHYGADSTAEPDLDPELAEAVEQHAPAGWDARRRLAFAVLLDVGRDEGMTLDDVAEDAIAEVEAMGDADLSELLDDDGEQYAAGPCKRGQTAKQTGCTPKRVAKAKATKGAEKFREKMKAKKGGKKVAPPGRKAKSKKGRKQRWMPDRLEASRGLPTETEEDEQARYAEEDRRAKVAEEAVKTRPPEHWGSKDQPYWRPGANPTVDMVLTRTNAETGEGEVLLIQRKEGTVEGGKWALPGGFVDTTAKKGEPHASGKAERPASAALRELKEETGLDAKTLRSKMVEVGKFARHGRDPRDNDEAWSESTAFHVDAGDLPDTDSVRGLDDAMGARWVPMREIGGMNLAFDHGEIMRHAGIKEARVKEQATVRQQRAGQPCKPGERSDLTGCDSGAAKEAGTPKATKGAEKPAPTLDEMRAEAGRARDEGRHDEADQIEHEMAAAGIDDIAESFDRGERKIESKSDAQAVLGDIATAVKASPAPEAQAAATYLGDAEKRKTIDKVLDRAVEDDAPGWASKVGEWVERGVGATLRDAAGSAVDIVTEAARVGVTAATAPIVVGAKLFADLVGRGSYYRPDLEAGQEGLAEKIGKKGGAMFEVARLAGMGAAIGLPAAIGATATGTLAVALGPVVPAIAGGLLGLKAYRLLDHVARKAYDRVFARKGVEEGTDVIPFKGLLPTAMRLFAAEEPRYVADAEYVQAVSDAILGAFRAEAKEFDEGAVREALAKPIDAWVAEDPERVHDVARWARGGAASKPAGEQAAAYEQGQPCKPGETAERSGCVPASGEPGGGQPAEKPAEKPTSRLARIKAAPKAALGRLAASGKQPQAAVAKSALFALDKIEKAEHAVSGRIEASLQKDGYSPGQAKAIRRAMMIPGVPGPATMAAMAVAGPAAYAFLMGTHLGPVADIAAIYLGAKYGRRAIGAAKRLFAKRKGGAGG